MCFWAEAGMCMLTRSLLLEHSSSGVGRSDCRRLDGNTITELAATLFDKLTNLQSLYVTLDAAMHTPFRSCLCGGEGCWAFVRGCPRGCTLFLRCVGFGGAIPCQQLRRVLHRVCWAADGRWLTCTAHLSVLFLLLIDVGGVWTAGIFTTTTLRNWIRTSFSH